MPKTAFSDPWSVRSGFTGTVILHNWITDPSTGVHVIGFHGMVRVLSDEELAGFEAKGHNTANWICRVQGARTSINIMGCQVRAVLQTEKPPADTSNYRVVE